MNKIIATHNSEFVNLQGFCLGYSLYRAFELCLGPSFGTHFPHENKLSLVKQLDKIAKAEHDEAKLFQGYPVTIEKYQSVHPKNFASPFTKQNTTDFIAFSKKTNSLCTRNEAPQEEPEISIVIADYSLENLSVSRHWIMVKKNTNNTHTLYDTHLGWKSEQVRDIHASLAKWVSNEGVACKGEIKTILRAKVSSTLKRQLSTDHTQKKSVKLPT